VVAIAICLAAVTVFSGCKKENPKDDPPPTLQHERGILVDGKIWATRNLTTDNWFVDNPEDYGALYQWGRRGDGHEQRNSPRYPTNNDSHENGVLKDVAAYIQVTPTHPAYGKFVKQCDKPGDWIAPQWTYFWGMEENWQTIKAPFDPCPPGWRLPNDLELESLYKHTKKKWGELNGVWGYFFCDFGNEDEPEKLFLPAAGYRWNENGEIIGEGYEGTYWTCSSHLFGSNWRSRFLVLLPNNVLAIDNAFRAYGFSVRCIEDRK